MLRALLIALFAAASFAQTAAPPPAPQPPAGVDRVLRARIKEFYDLLVTRQYRKAEELVAPDYRDTYYDGDKPRYMSYDLTSVTYSADFTRADVVVAIKLPPISPLNPAPIVTPAASIWRLLDGVWYWSLPRLDVMDIVRALAGGKPATDANGAPVLPPAETPMPVPGQLPAGVNLPATLPGGINLAPALPGNPNLPAGLGRPEAMIGAGETAAPQFSMDRTEVVLKPSSIGQVTISNDSSAPMTLLVLGKLPGIESAFDRTLIQPNEKAVLSIHAAADAKGGALLIGVAETKAMVSLPVTVK